MNALDSTGGLQTAVPCRTERQPWLRLPEEQPRHYEWFHHWLMLGPRRTLPGAYSGFARRAWEDGGGQGEFKPPNRVSGAWERVVVANDWYARAEAFDQWNREKNEQDYEQRRREYQAASWQFVLELHQRVRDMLSHPLTERETTGTDTDETGQAVLQHVILKPSRWSIADVPRLLSAADRLARTATAIEVLAVMRELERLNADELFAQAKAFVENLSREAEAAGNPALRAGESGGANGDAGRSENPDQGEAAGTLHTESGADPLSGHAGE